ncbi:unnamed protein product [Dracunculus medinensis]|uniref:Uncharacterized protein n=1 Tax=Dracunculus medinensis TaxID=318479 RepID=A0A0N4U0I3_DRAME|nr:unnamed protein product [Dracunculus medinensis]
MNEDKIYYASIAVKSSRFAFFLEYCYSCASTNMQQSFLTKQRGPQKRIQKPKVFDDFCNLDAWIIKERSKVECDGPCFKWQEIVNNSGSLSFMTLRSCYSSMFNASDVKTANEPLDSHCIKRPSMSNTNFCGKL